MKSKGKIPLALHPYRNFFKGVFDYMRNFFKGVSLMLSINKLALTAPLYWYWNGGTMIALTNETYVFKK
jgi:hypothetical protein